MAEYVVDLNGVETKEVVTDDDRFMALWGLPVRERIVRCRDCEYYTPESMTREERGFGTYENVWEPGGCFNPERCSSAWDAVLEQMVPVGICTESDGFCKWGRPKEESTEELKPCPFCGGKAHIITAVGESWVLCVKCKATTEAHTSRQFAIDAWNRRAES